MPLRCSELASNTFTYIILFRMNRVQYLQKGAGNRHNSFFGMVLQYKLYLHTIWGIYIRFHSRQVHKCYVGHVVSASTINFNHIVSHIVLK